jgi:hypothetical protein
MADRNFRGNTRKMKCYSKEDLEKAINAVQEEGMSMREACKEFNVPRTTLGDRIHQRHGVINGRQPELTPDEETMLVDRMKLLGVWGFPFTAQDLCHFVKIYLDKKGAVTRFKDNLPTHRQCFISWPIL